MMLSKSFIAASLLAASAAAVPATTTTSPSSSSSSAAASSNPSPDADGKYWISSDSIKAAFIPYGASLSSLIINDKTGTPRDIVIGFDNATAYSTDTRHDHFGGVPGRYANRIKNSTFTIDGETYHVLPNDNPTDEAPDGADTLHGGPNGWDWRNFTVVSHTDSSITFSLVDPDGDQGFPGEVVSLITYTLTGNTWDLSMVAIPTTKKTPIMLSSHVYWNLDGFQNPDTNLALDHVFHMPYAGFRVDVDGILIPTGNLLANEKGGVNDFWSEPKVIGSSFNDSALEGNCGAGCVGYDNCYVTNREALRPFDWAESPVATLSSPWSGISLDVFTDQDAFQLYSCNFQDGEVPLKKTQGFFDDANHPRVIQKYGCVVLEVQDWIDGINHPEWNREKKQVFAPGETYTLNAKYVFSVGN